MTVENVFIGKIVGHIVEKALKHLFSLVPEKSETTTNFSADFEIGLTNQIKKAVKFSENLETFRYDDKRVISENTISLSINNSIRQSYHSLENSIQITENHLLTEARSQLILGDPGAGKTTTLKRLIHEAFRLIFEEDENAYPYNFPLFFKLAEIPENESFFVHFAKSMGITYERSEKKVNYDEIQQVAVYSPENKFADPDGYIQHEKVVKKTRIEYEYKIGHLPLETAICQIVDEFQAVIFLDGLDELHFKIRDKVFEEIKKLLSILNKSKLIITSRYFEDIDTFKNISKNEILPLSKEESLEIVQKWITDDPATFWKKLDRKPYKGLATRPLFLFYLVMLYNANKGILPEQGVDVYRQVVLLVLREWDEQKEHKTIRFSKFDSFDTYKKEEFLGDIAFYLTYELGIKKIFSHSDLTRAFVHILKRYPQLKAGDAESVIKDIETDNGLIITSFANEYEFSHLSLQEYLCAKHILSIPFSRKIFDYLTKNPEPLALAVVLSSEPSNWFAMLVLNNINEPQFTRKITPSIIYIFVDRLVTEGVVFDQASVEFGMAILFLVFIGGTSNQTRHVLSKFLENKEALESARQAAKMFKIAGKKGSEVNIERKVKVYSDLFLNFPDKGVIPIFLWKKINN